MSDFLWGVATAAYQVEGGLNGFREPANNWAGWDRSGRVERCGEALRFHADPDVLLDLAAGLGCNAFRLSIEWARLQPSADYHEAAEPRWDASAVDHYARLISEIRRRGMEPVVTLFHFTHPMWCGQDFWLRPDAPARFERYVRRAVELIGLQLAERGTDPVRWWITINEPAVVPLLTYFLGKFPGAARGIRATATAFDNTIAAHVRAYDAVHDTYERHGWGSPLVSTNGISLTTVALDAVATDLLLARERGVPSSDLALHLGRTARRARARLAAVERRSALAAGLDVVLDRAARIAMPKPDGAAVRALYASPRARKLDYLSLDHYDPVAGHLVAPGWPPRVGELWEQNISAANLAVFLRHAHLLAPDRPILVAEHGMCTPGSHPRPDGLRRDDAIRTAAAEIVRARSEGINVAGYLHWTLADNYEWGSYKPRFGLFGVDRTSGVKILETDASGVDAAAAYRDVVSGARVL